MKPLFDVERHELAAQLVPSYRATQIFKSVYQRWTGTFEEMTDLPKQARSELAAAWDLQAPRIHRRFDSTDGTRRYLVVRKNRGNDISAACGQLMKKWA